MNMKGWIGKVAVVTGASAGIGLAIAESLVDSGLKVVGLARRKEKLQELAQKLQGKQEQFYPFKADISKETEIENAFHWITNNVGPVHILVNNAGIGRPNGLLDGNAHHWEEILRTNILGLCVATKEAVKIMRANHINGHVIHINSITGHHIPNYPNLNIYPATKHAVTALTETLRHELNYIDSKVKITSISPGRVKSEFIVASQRTPEAPEDTLESMPILEAEDIAAAVVYVLGTPPHVQVHELIIKPVGERI